MSLTLQSKALLDSFASLFSSDQFAMPKIILAIVFCPPNHLIDQGVVHIVILAVPLPFRASLFIKAR